MSSSSYFGTNKSLGNVKTADSSELLKAIKLQTIFNANQSNPKSSVRTAGHTNPPEQIAQYNAVAQQLNYGVRHTQLPQ
jgi:hypothetical protein